MQAGLAPRRSHHPAEQYRVHGQLRQERRDLHGRLQDFAKQQGPNLKLIISWAAQTQVQHWMDVIGDWKKMLGADWDQTYAASNTIYVARQNNVLFSVLAQYFGPDAINDRLMLIETVSFTTTPQDMLESMTRIISDRTVGSIFFGNYHLMDYELMGGNARATIICRGRQTRNPAGTPASRAVRFAPVSDPHHAGARRDVARRSAVKDTSMNLNTIRAVQRPASADEISHWQDGYAWLAGGTWLFSEPQFAADTLIDLEQLGWPALKAEPMD